MKADAHPFRPAAPWLWVALSSMAWFASLLVALPLGHPLAAVFAGSDERLRWDLAAVLALSGLASVGATVLLARLIFRRWLAVRPVAPLFWGLGVVLAIAVEMALHEWTGHRFGYYDWDFVRWTAGLSAMLVITAVATFGVLIAPVRAAASLAVQIPAALVVCLIVASNVPGLGDGIDPESWPLAILVGLSAAYAAAAIAIGLLARRSPANVIT